MLPAQSGPVTLVAMTEDLWSAPVAGAPFTSRSLAHLALAGLARETADWARALVPVGPRPDQAYGGVLVGDAAALVERAQQVLAAAVLVERDDGADWSQIASSLGLTVDEVLSRWELAHHEWSQTHPGYPVDAAAVEQGRAGELAELDAWVVRHREPGDPDAGAAPVSAVMNRQHPLLELLHLQGLERRYTEDYGPASTERAAVLARQAGVHEALAERAEVADVADEHRSCAAALRRTLGQIGDAREAAEPVDQ